MTASWKCRKELSTDSLLKIQHKSQRIAQDSLMETQYKIQIVAQDNLLEIHYPASWKHIGKVNAQESLLKLFKSWCCKNSLLEIKQSENCSRQPLGNTRVRELLNTALGKYKSLGIAQDSLPEVREPGQDPKQPIREMRNIRHEPRART
jgi:hypothetical protein